MTDVYDPPGMSFITHRHFFLPEHPGLDFDAPDGTPIPVAANGRVVGRGYEHKYGNMVIVRHRSTRVRRGEYIYTLYAHMNGWPPVAPGDYVYKDSVIGEVGKTGVGSHDENHLHFELIRLVEDPETPFVDTWEQLWNNFAGTIRRTTWTSTESRPVPLSLDGTEGRVDPQDADNWYWLVN